MTRLIWILPYKLFGFYIDKHVYTGCAHHPKEFGRSGCKLLIVRANPHTRQFSSHDIWNVWLYSREGYARHGSIFSRKQGWPKARYPCNEIR